MAMQVKHIDRQPDLADELKLNTEFNEWAEVVIHLHIHREIVIRENGEKTYTLFINGGIYKDNTTIQEFEDNYNYWYHGRNFRQLMKNEFAELRRCIKRLNHDYKDVALTITRGWQVIEY